MNVLTKYSRVFSLSLAEVFAWKLNFILWRVRVVLQFLLLYFLWSTVFLKDNVVFGYERSQMLTYILLVAFLRSLILSSRNQDVAGEIRDGYLTNFLLRPISYFGWWWTKDAVDKLINIIFAAAELSLLYLLVRPEVILQTDIIIISLTLAATVLALILYFYFSFLISLLAFWTPEIWGIRFLIIIALEFFSGGIFPLDILPAPLFKIITLTPFPYFLFFPAKLYLGKLLLLDILTGFAILVMWIIISIGLVHVMWARGLRMYGGEGR